MGMFLLGSISGFVTCLILLYMIGRSRHEGHAQATGPTSKTNTKENVVSIVKKG